jgi:hypothetical protein
MKDESPAKGAGSISHQIAELSQLSIPELKRRWRSFYPSDPHQRMSRVAHPRVRVWHPGTATRWTQTVYSEIPGAGR